MSNFIFNNSFQASAGSTNEEYIFNNLLYNYMLPAFVLLFGLTLGIWGLKFLTRPRYYVQQPSNYYGHSKSAKIVATKPVVAYKTAKITFDAVYKDSNVISLHFNGVSGNVRYGMKEDYCRGEKGFHMYKNIDDAFNHDQYGNVILEVLGYGNVNEYDKGYTTTGQKILQIIIDSMVFNKDDNIRIFMERNNLTLKDLYTTQWRNHDGIEVIFSPKKNFVFYNSDNKYTIPQYKQTITS